MVVLWLCWPLIFVGSFLDGGGRRAVGLLVSTCGAGGQGFHVTFGLSSGIPCL